MSTGIADKCSACGRKGLKQRIGDVRFEESGLSNVVLLDVPILECECGEEIIGLPRLKRILDEIAKRILVKPERLSGEEIRFLRKRMRMTTSEFARKLDVARETLSRWENDKIRPRPITDRTIRLFYCQKMGVDSDLNDMVIDISDKIGEPTASFEHVIASRELTSQ